MIRKSSRFKNQEKKDQEIQASTIKEKSGSKRMYYKYYNHENSKNILFIKNWSNVEGICKALFETDDEIIEDNTWQARYSDEDKLYEINYSILDNYLKSTQHLKLYIGENEPSRLHSIEPLSFYSLNKRYPSKTGYIIYTGYPIWGLDWCPGYLEGKQYLAVSGHPDYETHSMLFSTTEPKNSTIQIWSFIPGFNDKLSNEPRLDIVILHAFGSVWDLKWCPLISKIQGKLGFLACIFGDGSARIFPVPISNKTDKILYIKLEQVKLSFNIYNTRCTCLCWISPNKIAVGTSNGQICVFDLEKKEPNIPIVSFFGHTTYIRNITSCSPSYPNLLITMNFIVQWWDKLSCIILNDNMCGLRFTFLHNLQSSNHIISLDGTLWAVAISPVHPFIAAVGADGTVTIVNFLKKTFAKLRQPLSMRKIYQLSIKYDDTSYLLVENFKPEKYQKIKSNPIVFPPEIGITVAAWNPTKKYGGWLASGSTSGILRVEDLSF
ncbi:hypothetical protein PCK2_000764 [Pneumocystis canis]|nr:hypothetical protein PCK2_000764 [Pneumocystis canis]